MAEKKIKFISEKHNAFYMEKMQNAKFKDVYHQALYYCLGVNACLLYTSVRTISSNTAQNRWESRTA